MKRFVYAAAAIILTGVLVLLAMAVAQRDARDARLPGPYGIENELAYANQQAQPISGSIADGLGKEVSVGDEWPPAPLVRGNDSPVKSYSPAANTPKSNPSEYASLITYTDVGSSQPGSNDTPTNIRKSTSKGSLAEPPPLSAFNKFLTPSTSNSSNSGSAGNPNANSANSLPTTPPNALPNPFPSLPNQPENFPISNNLPQSNPANPSIGSLNRFPMEQPDPAYAHPPTLGLPRMPTDSESNAGSKSTIDSSEFPRLPSNMPPNSDGIQTPRLPITTSLQSTQELPPTATLGMPMQPSQIPSSPNPYPKNSPPFDAPSSFNASPTTQTSPAMTKSAGFSSAAPGVRQLDGSQNPSMEIQKRAPSEVQVGIPATFTVLVRNVGNATAFDVHVVDAIPKGARLVRTNPQSQPNGPNGLTWKLGDMPAGAEQTITIELVPELEGEIGSVASVNFAAQASVRTMSTQPKLVVKQLLEPLVLGGESVKILIDVSNTGTGTARNVRLEEDVPENMRHASGAKVLELSVGDLAPGESQKFNIELTAVTAGKVSNILRAIAENATANESATPIEVISPKLKIGLDGPKLRYLERQATYTASIINTGTAIATNVDLIVYLPSGLQFNSAENGGEYVPNQHAVMWQLAELAAGKTAATKVTLLPVEEGDFVLRMQANADSIRAEGVEKPVRVEGQSELAFSIEDDNDPIETDGKTTYIIKIVNNGTRVDNDVQLSIDLPDGASIEQVDAPVNYQVTQLAVQFSPIPQMKSKDQQTIRIAVRHSREGTHVLRAQLKSKLRPGAVIKEESTQVYRDQ